METHLDYRVSDPDDLSKGKYQKHPKRKRTTFTKKQLADLNFLFNKNPYPTPSLQREMTSKMDIHPTVLQVWFKNRRAKLKKAKYEDFQSEQQEAQQQLSEAGGKISSSKGNMDTPPRSPNGTSPASLVYMDRPISSFQLSRWRNLKAVTDHSLGHKMVHFGYCQYPNIYCLYPILETQALSTSFNSNSFGSFSP
ncbi:divergent paired-related homeobox [Balaenoptera musculus]|uniref:Divergent paired-related homeobox n=1 Tax=Balaenoptera musculus TaxID=9771 RepID=A0A8B8VYX1_BALMU|nr:divergent paired-related homeobox [Balaenoptera musculus]